MKKFVVLTCAAMLVLGVAGAASALNLIENGEFDAGLVGWNYGGDVAIENIPFVGNYAILGPGHGYLYQDFDIPVGAQTLDISFDFAFGGNDRMHFGYDEVWVSLTQSIGISGWPDMPFTFDVLLDAKSPEDYTFGHVSTVIDVASWLGLMDANAGIFSVAFNEGTPFWCNDSRFAIGNIVVDAVPEPSTVLLLGAGVLGLVGLGRKKFKK